MTDRDLLLLPATRIVALLAQGELSASELAEQHIAQIDRLNPQLNALVDYDPARIRSQAASLDRLPRDRRGPLHGLPVTVKSSISVAGHLCEIGTLLNRGHRPAGDATVVARLRAAGALLLGTTNCPEFLMAYDTENRLHGQTRNPWDLTRTAGGSSGGESAAIAAGLSAAGLGSDSGGSVRVPAHFTGICALKPTPGRIPAAGHLPPCFGPFAFLGAIGPMARTIGDVDLLFRTLSGADDADPSASPLAYRPVPEQHLHDATIGYLEDDGLVPVTAETRAAVRAAAAILQQQGFRVEPVDEDSRAGARTLVQSLERARQLWWKFFVQGGAMLLDPLIRDRVELLSPTFEGFLGIARAEPPLSGDQLLAAWIESDEVRSELLTHMRRYPILLTPVCAVPAFRHGERNWSLPDAHGSSRQIAYLDAMRYTQWFNLLGAPAAIVPVGRSPEGLPIGVQVAGRPYHDEHVLAVAAAIDSSFGYQPPPLT